MSEEFPARLRCVCTEHGPVPTSPCPICNDETYDLSEPDDLDFVRGFVAQQRFKRQLQAVGIGIVAGFIELFAFGETGMYATMMLAFLAADALLHALQPRERKQIEAAVAERPRGRSLTSTPMITVLGTIAAFTLTTTLVPKTLFEDPTLGVSTAALDRWAMAPTEVLAGRKLYTVITYAGLHADVGHLIGNAFGLLIFGLSVDLRVGRLGCALVVLLGAIGGALAEALLASDHDVHLIGASGAVYALAGASLTLMPMRMWTVNLGGSHVRLPAYMALPMWMLLLGGFEALVVPNLSWLGHGGGLVTGAIVGLVLRSIPAPLDYNERQQATLDTTGD